MAAFVQKREIVADNVSSVSLAYTANVANGNLLTVEAARFSPVNDAFVAGDLTKSAGTATIGTIALDAQTESSDGVYFVQTGIFSAPCTGSGSLTWTLSGDAGCYFWINISEWSGTNSTKEASTTGTGTSTTPSSGNATSAGGGLFLGCLACNTSLATVITPDAAFTELNEEEDGTLHVVGASEYRIVGSGTTDAADWTLDASQTWGAVVAVYADSAPATDSQEWRGSISVPHRGRDAHVAY